MLHKCFLFIYMAFYIPTYHAKVQNYQRIFQVIVTTDAPGSVLQTKITYGDFLMRPKKRGLFKKSPYVIFFSETNPESPFQHHDGIKKKP